ncbi:MAG: M48 family metallopeptidase [Arcobacter sp.]|uniref:M48 metallopeptidase family protein n=1 Tax=Arcobacter sp. TaxID=1872629 RepID=UPI003C771424
MKNLKYLNHYPKDIISQIQKLIDDKKLDKYLLNKYKISHDYKNDKALYSYAMDFKNSYLKKSLPLSKVIYDGKINVINDALGLHTIISRVQGGKLKSKNEIRIGTLFKNVPEEFLRMIVVHELAHLKEKEHDKAFYSLCCFMEPNYHQFEFDLRVYLTYMDLYGKLY